MTDHLYRDTNQQRVGLIGSIMDWRCPACGADNEETILRCTCGYVREAPKSTNFITGKSILRWSLLIASLAGSLYLLNIASYCAWASGGPPTDYPKAWLQRFYILFGFSAALMASGDDWLHRAQKHFQLETFCSFLYLDPIFDLLPRGAKNT